MHRSTMPAAGNPCAATCPYRRATINRKTPIAAGDNGKTIRTHSGAVSSSHVAG